MNATTPVSKRVARSVHAVRRAMAIMAMQCSGALGLSAPLPPGSLGPGGVARFGGNRFYLRALGRYGPVFKVLWNRNLAVWIVGFDRARHRLALHGRALAQLTIDITPFVPKGFLRGMPREEHDAYRKLILTQPDRLSSSRNRQARARGNRIAKVNGSFLAAVIVTMAVASPAAAQQPDTVLLNGKILTVDRASSTREALAIRGGQIVAAGTTAEVRRLAGSATRVIDLQGRTVIPGLIDSHMHAIRAAQFFATEVNWIGAPTVTDALARVRAAAQARPGAWLIVAGGWTEKQFREGRRPTQAELQVAAPSNPVYVQLGYQWAVLTTQAWTALKITADADLPPGATFERDASGTLTGAVTGSQAAIVAMFDKLPKPTYEQKVDGTLKFFRELNRLGITGVVDPGGNNLTAPDYEALLDVWRRKAMTVRVAYTLCSQTAGVEFDELKQLTTLLPMGFGDDLLHFNGIGERITAAMYNNDRPTDADKERFYEIALWAARRGMSLTIHWGRDASVDHLLGVFERVNREVPIAPLRWSVAHLDDASEQTLNRMKALGVGWTMQDAMYFGGDGFLQERGRDVGLRTPPLETARRIGVVTGAGTDAHRVASYNPFTALQWLLDGRSVSGTSLRGPAETPSRADALRLYTMGSAWFSFDDSVRGSLEVGKLADLAVLSKDYMTVPVQEIGGLESLLTMVGGRIVYAAGPYARLDQSQLTSPH